MFLKILAVTQKILEAAAHFVSVVAKIFATAF
jgi:hypothetical protein